MSGWRRPGFTLLEVLIALAIFAGAAIALGGSYLNVLNSYARVDEAAQRNEDLAFARQMLASLNDREAVEAGASFTTADGRQVTWRAVVEPTELPDLFIVNFLCEIGGAPGEDPQAVTQRFRLLRPTWSEAAERAELQQQVRERIIEERGARS